MSKRVFIQAQGLVKIHQVAGVEAVALQGLDLEVAEGEFVALVGPSGSGKSTLLAALGGLDRPSAGRLRVGGVDLLGLSPARLTEYRRRQVGFVWQQTARNLLPALSARANVELLAALDGMPARAARARAAELLGAVGMAEHADRPLGRLSGGQQQRAALACALACRPALLLGDEPTGEVDWPTARRILDLLGELRARYGLTVVVVTHDERVAAAADRVVAIRDGRASGERPGAERRELALIDGAGRLQLPADLRAQARLARHAQVELAGDSLLIRPVAPAAPEADEPAADLGLIAALYGEAAGGPGGGGAGGRGDTYGRIAMRPNGAQPDPAAAWPEPGAPWPEPTEGHALALTGVARSYPGPGGGVHALRGVSLLVRRGELVAISGPSGSGKTTLLNIAAGLDQPSSGSVRLLGADTGGLDATALAALRRRAGLIFQSFALLAAASAYENVELALRLAGQIPQSEWDRRARACLGAVGLGPWLHHRPYELSGGQQQRVAIARALAPAPALIIADEPTGDLDAATGRQVLALLRGLAERAGVAILMATHDPAALAVAHRRYELRDGLIA